MTKLSKDQVLDLQLILEALYQSEPKAKHYVEPMERHTRAIQKLIRILNDVGPEKEEETIVSFAAKVFGEKS